MDTNFLNRSYYQVQVIDTEQHSRKEKDLGVKNSGCRQFSFLSEADSKLHYRLAHGGKRGNDDSDTKVPRKFKYGKYNNSYLTQYRPRKYFEETPSQGKTKE